MRPRASRPSRGPSEAKAPLTALYHLSQGQRKTYELSLKGINLGPDGVLLRLELLLVGFGDEVLLLLAGGLCGRGRAGGGDLLGRRRSHGDNDDGGQSKDGKPKSELEGTGGG